MEALETVLRIKRYNRLEGQDSFGVLHGAVLHGEPASPLAFRNAPQAASHGARINAPGDTDPVPATDTQWNLYSVGWNEATAVVDLSSLPSPMVAILDSGFFTAHPELSTLVDQRDFVPAFEFSTFFGTPDEDGYDDDAEEVADPAYPFEGCHGFHGTHVATTVGASQGNGGMVGVYPGVDMMGIRLGRSLAPTCRSIFAYTDALLYAAGLPNAAAVTPDRKADVVNMSFGGSGFSAYIQDVIDQVVDAGLILVASAGNSGFSGASYPASYDGVFSVSATNIFDSIATYSTYGPFVDIAAPGGEAFYDSNDDGVLDGIYAGIAVPNIDLSGFDASFAPYNGTSMAAPHVAGGFAIMRAIAPDMPADVIDAYLRDGRLTDDIGASGRDDFYGHGLMSLPKMVAAAQLYADTGFVPGVPADVLVTPNTLAFGEGAAARTLFASEDGDYGDIAIRQVSSTNTAVDGEQWLGLAVGDVGENGFGAYRFVVDRSNLSPGPHSGSVEFVLDNGETKSIAVSTARGTDLTTVETSPFWVMLLKSEDNTLTLVQYQTFAELGVDGVIVDFENVAAGDYLIAVGTDMDYDGEICDGGEICTVYPGPFQDLTAVRVDDVSMSMAVTAHLDDIRGALPLNEPIPVTASGVMTMDQRMEAPRTTFSTPSLK